jgi:hypothetical protein
MERGAAFVGDTCARIGKLNYRFSELKSVPLVVNIDDKKNILDDVDGVHCDDSSGAKRDGRG